MWDGLAADLLRKWRCQREWEGVQGKGSAFQERLKRRFWQDWCGGAGGDSRVAGAPSPGKLDWQVLEVQIPF